MKQSIPPKMQASLRTACMNTQSHNSMPLESEGLPKPSSAGRKKIQNRRDRSVEIKYHPSICGEQIDGLVNHSGREA
jgi:hypothetical protein